MTDRPTRISTDIDFNKDGKQVGNLFLPWSRNVSAYSVIHIPVACIKNGDGPTMLYTGGTHGDEYEGQVALLNLIRELDPKHIKGRIIAIPAANFPAAMAGRRLSPYDEGNLNRAYPGDPEGGPTAQIAFYIGHHLVPMANAFHDFHAGGTSLEYSPFVSCHLTGNSDLSRRQLELAKTFGAPMVVIGRGSDDRLAQRAAHKRGIMALGGEFGGRGAVSRKSVAPVEIGIRNELAHLGILPATAKKAPEKPSQLVELAGRSYYVYAMADGLFEPHVELGERVVAGQKAGRLHFVDDPLRPPLEPTFARDGIVVCRRAQGRCERGDCVVHLVTEFSGALD
jgi:predicted deacylase